MQSLELMDNSKMPKLRNELTITDEHSDTESYIKYSLLKKEPIQQTYTFRV